MMSVIKEDLVNIDPKTTGLKTTFNSGSSGSLTVSCASNTAVNTLLKKQYLEADKRIIKKEAVSKPKTKLPSVNAIVTNLGKVLTNIKQNQHISQLNQDQTKSNEKFIVKSIHAVEPAVKPNVKTKIHPVFGHNTIQRMTLEKGEFPVIYIGSPSDTNETPKSNAREKGIHSPLIPSKLTSKSTSVSFNKKTSALPLVTVTTSTSPLPPLSSLLTQTQPLTKSICNDINIDSAYEASNGSPTLEYDIQKAMDGFVNSTKKSQVEKYEPVKINIDENSPTMIPSRKKVLPGFPTVTHYSRNEIDMFQQSSFHPVPLTTLTYKIQSPNICRTIAPKAKLEALTTKATTVKSISTTISTSAATNSTIKVTNLTSTITNPASFSTSSINTVTLPTFNIQSTVVSSTTISTTKHLSQSGKLVLSTASSTKPATFRIISIPKSTTASPSVPKYPVITVTNLKSTISNAVVQPTIAVKRKSDDKTEEPSTKYIIQTSKGMPRPNPVKPMIVDTQPRTSTIPLNKLQIKPTFKYTTDLSSTFAKKPGALVKFEDGLQMWVNSLRDMTYEDDEPIKSWDLKPGLKVVVKYTDGLYYDAEVISSYGGKPTILDSKKPMLTSKHNNNTTMISSKKPAEVLTQNNKNKDSSDKNDGESKDNGQNTWKIKCPNCFLMFFNVMLFRKHQKTVCGCSGITVATDSNKPSSLVEVDDSSVPPLVKNYKKENEDKVNNIPRTSEGKRWFRRGTSILHRWQTTQGGSKWYSGKILRLLDSQKGQQTEFEVEYLDEDHGSGPYAVSLYEDYPHDIRIVTR